ncbi:MAG: hypothetical protein ABI432_00375 [Flavobacteriales bacterium]
MTRLFLLYLVVVAAPSLVYAGFVWWRTWSRNRREDHWWDQWNDNEPIATHREDVEEIQPFGATELDHSRDEPEAARLFRHIALQRRSILDNAQESNAQRQGECERT